MINVSKTCFLRKKVPAVPESLLKRRKAYAAMKAMRVKKLLAEKKVNSTSLCSLQKRLFFFSKQS